MCRKSGYKASLKKGKHWCRKYATKDKNRSQGGTTICVSRHR